MFPRKDLSECDDDNLIMHVSEVISVLTWQTFRACVMCKAKVQTKLKTSGLAQNAAEACLLSNISTAKLLINVVTTIS